MLILGADPDELNAAAQLLTAHADEYDRADKQIAYWLQRMGWTGSEADRVRAAYRSRMGPQLRSTASELRHAATELRANAALQQAASSGNTNSTPSRPAPSDKQDPFQDLTPPHRRWTREELDALGIGSVMGTRASLALRSPKVAGWTRGAHATASTDPMDFVTLPSDAKELFEALKDLRWDDEESAKRVTHAAGDLVFGIGLAIAPFAPVVGAFFMAFGAGIKGGAYGGSFFFDTLYEIYQYGKGAREDLIGWTSAGFEWTGDRADDIGDAFSDAAKDTYDALSGAANWGVDRADDIGDAFSDVGKDIYGGASGIANWGGDRADDIGDAFSDVGKDIYGGASGIANWGGDRLDDMGDAADGIFSGVKGWILGGDDG